MRAGSLILGGFILFVVSCWLLVIASTNPDHLPSWAGPVDVVIAFTLFLVLLQLHRFAKAPATLLQLRRSHVIASAVGPFVILAMWVFREHLIWNTLLPGVAWRLYFIVAATPLSLAVWQQSRPTADQVNPALSQQRGV